MKITEDKSSGGQIITGYGEDFIAVNEISYQQSLIVSPQHLSTDWPASQPADLTLANLQPLITLEPELILLGTGAKQIFPAAEVTAWFLSQKIGCEVMDTSAACRTYNILVSEGRKVIAALLLPE